MPNPTRTLGTQATTSEAAALAAIAETLGIQITRDQDIGEILLSAVSAIKNERDDLKEKVAFKNGREGKSIIAASRDTSGDDQAVKSMTDLANGRDASVSI